MNVIDTFYVIDFDRCIGNINESFRLLREIIHDLSIVDEQTFSEIRIEVESRGNTFSAIEYIKNNYKSVDLDLIEKMYLKRALVNSSKLLESGAKIFLDTLSSRECYFCIMSFGDKKWQLMKIRGAGIKNTPAVIVSKSEKGEYINEWFDPSSGIFRIPKDFFLDKRSRQAKEIVLVDDKLSAFINLLPKVRGYLVTGASNKVVKNKKISQSIKRVVQIDEIISYEF